MVILNLNLQLWHKMYYTQKNWDNGVKAKGQTKMTYQFSNRERDGERYFYHGNHASAALSTSVVFTAYMTIEMQSIREDYKKISTPEQTGYSYFGARYYSPELSIWLSVDPLASHFPGWSPCAAFNNNPINLVDSDGRAAVPPGKTYDDETGEMIHDDGIDDKKVYIGTKTDGSDRELVGIEGNGPGQIKDHTQKFNDQLDRTGKFFSEKAQDFGNKYHSDVVTGIASVDKMLFFKKSVTDKGPFDIKVSGKGFSQGEVGEYSFYGGKLFRYDDYGNFNYGRAASAFGYGEKTALLGAGLNQTGKAIFNLDYAKKNWYPISNFSNLGDDPRDSYMIKQGFNHAR